MKKLMFIGAALAVCCLCVATAPAAATDNKTTAPVSTSHAMLPGVLPLFYKATAGHLVLKDDKGAQTARIFYIAYEKRGLSAGTRPITFAFNGGPGSSSVWLHLGALGPKRVALNDDGSPPTPPARLITNDFSWLSFTDLVFIDPVGTGYSRPVEEKNDKQFYDMKADIESVGDFIRLYLTRAQRWSSPLYLCGESYGTTRAVGLLGYLHDKHGIDPTGIVLISPVLDFSTISFQQTNDLAYVLALPTYAATARFHKKGSCAFPEPDDARSAAEQFATSDYLTALAGGSGLNARSKEEVSSRLAGLCGVSLNYALQNNLRIAPSRFRKELLRDNFHIVGRMDARLTMPDTDGGGDTATADPSLDRYSGLFASAINDYLQRSLNVRDDLPYWFLNGDVGKAWNWRPGIQGSQGYVDVSQQLTDAMHLNPSLRVFIAAGLYDLATPYFAAVYTVNHLALDRSLAKNIVLHTYPAGHMMYTDRATLRQLNLDAAAFYRKR
ncbi:MAG: peptidase S10 [Deltaproteobacteria bacterium]|nr:peptidase S10 [Deltaproteobacteria bacterium]